MAAQLETRELPDRLEYRVTQHHTRIRLFLRIAVWMIAVCLPFRIATDSLFFAIVASAILLYAALKEITRARRGTDVTLTVTERDITSDGYTENEYHSLNRGRIQAPDLSWKKSHSDSEDGPFYPAGVYCGDDCVLPLVTMEEGHRIIERIYSRFRDTACDSRYDDSSTPSTITTLGLSGH